MVNGCFVILAVYKKGRLREWLWLLLRAFLQWEVRMGSGHEIAGDSHWILWGNEGIFEGRGIFYEGKMVKYVEFV